MLYPALALIGLYLVSQSGGTTRPPATSGGSSTTTRQPTEAQSIASDVANALIAASRSAQAIIDDAYNRRTSTTG